MSLATFDAFHESLCELVGVQSLPPDSQEVDADTEPGFTLKLEDTEVGFLETESGGMPAVLMMVKFGAVDPSRELDVLRELLDTNHFLSRDGSPAFVRDPSTAEISLHQRFALGGVDAQQVYQRMMNFVDTAQRWRSGSLEADHVLEGAHAEHGGVRP